MRRKDMAQNDATDPTLGAHTSHPPAPTIGFEGCFEGAPLFFKRAPHRRAQRPPRHSSRVVKWIPLYHPS
jgi:hypothetical protein